MEIPVAIETINQTFIILLFIAIALLAAIFLVGRSSGIRTAIDKKDSKDYLQNQIRELREEKSQLFRDASKAEENITRWQQIQTDHKNLDKMKKDLDDFEVQESKRIDRLEIKRAELAARLRELQAIQDAYPPEIFEDFKNWKKILEERREEIDQLENKKQDLIDEIENLKKRQQEKRNDDVKDVIKALKDVTIQFPDNALPVDVKTMPPSISDETDKLGAFRTLPDCLKDFEGKRDDADEEQILDDFEKALKEAQLLYSPRIIRAFHTALKVNDLSPLTVLSGLSGTGKSQLPRAYSQFFGLHFLHVPVEPGWDSPQDILGFYDFVSARYRPTDRARALGFFDSRFAESISLPTDKDFSDRMLIVLLDEMNLARTEYYFSEFLSRLEMRGVRKVADQPKLEQNDEAKIIIDLPYAENEVPKSLYVPHNVFWVGTLNEDETTQSLSDKVLDRANSIRFAPPDPDLLQEHSTAPELPGENQEGYLSFDTWLNWSNKKKQDEPKVVETLKDLAKCMQNSDRAFGYRLNQSMRAYIDRYPGTDWREPIVDQINMRLLPKLAGTEMIKCRDSIGRIKELCENDLSDKDFSDAINKATETSEKSGIFTWPGYTYRN